MTPVTAHTLLVDDLPSLIAFMEFMEGRHVRNLLEKRESLADKKTAKLGGSDR